MQLVNFWNGNKTVARQRYETELLEACLAATASSYGYANLQVDNTDYPLARDEANVFDAGADILVTVAGNVKFKDRPKIVIHHPLAKGLLGYRLLLVREQSLASFRAINKQAALQALTIGIPATWADADLFRHNRYRVVERGGLDDLFSLLRDGAFDYTALGINEIESVFEQFAQPLGGICVEPSLMLYYPFPLVFYINQKSRDLAERVQAGLNAISTSGKHHQIFISHHGDVVRRLQLQQRKIFLLENPLLPEELAGFKPSLMV